jgi:hypothetical protein
MQSGDLLIEVRSPGLDRVGRVLAKHTLELAAEVPVNAIGNWTLTIPLDSPMAQYLMTEGYGILVTDQSSSEVLFSGPSTSIGIQYNGEHPGGVLIVSGVTDEVAIDDALAWPDPDNDDEALQAVARDEREDVPWVLIRDFVNANIGSTATSTRKNKYLTVDLDEAEFPSTAADVKASARFDNLLTLIQGIATPASVIFRVRQIGGRLRMSIQPVDKRVMRLRLPDLASASLTLDAPNSTRIFVGGDGTSTSRTFLEYNDAVSLEAEELWGRRIERFAAGTGTTLELQTAGKTALAQDGFATLTARFEPTENLRNTFGNEWSPGDTAIVELVGREYTAPINGLLIKADTEGLRIGVTLGDVTQTGDQIKKRLSDLETYR